MFGTFYIVIFVCSSPLIPVRACMICILFFHLIGNCRYGVDLAKQLTTNLLSVLPSCGSIRICFSNRTPEKVLLRMYIFLLWFVLCSGTNCSPFARLQVSNVISKELGGNPKVYIWDGQGIM